MNVFDEKRILAEIKWFALSEEGGSFSVGHNGVTRIVLSADGHGLTGFYSQLHVFKSDGLYCTYPAHSVLGWDYKEKDNQ